MFSTGTRVARVRVERRQRDRHRGLERLVRELPDQLPVPLGLLERAVGGSFPSASFDEFQRGHEAAYGAREVRDRATCDWRRCLTT